MTLQRRELIVRERKADKTVTKSHIRELYSRNVPGCSKTLNMSFPNAKMQKHHQLYLYLFLLQVSYSKKKALADKPEPYYSQTSLKDDLKG